MRPRASNREDFPWPTTTIPTPSTRFFSDIEVSAADLYDLFGFPSDDTTGGERVVIALTFASVPKAGVLDSDMLYRVLVKPDRRVVRPAQEDHSLDHLLEYFEGLKDRYLGTLRPLEVRVTVDKNNRAAIRFINFPGGGFSQVIDTNTSVTVKSPAGHPIKVYIGGPPGPWTWTGDKYKRDANGNYRFVYTGTNAQAGKNVNAIILEVPLDFITRSPSDERIVNAWGESWVAKAARKVETILDEPFWLEHLWSLIEAVELDEELKKYKLVDTDGQPFADAGLSEREHNRQLGANNFWLAPHFIKRLAYLAGGSGRRSARSGCKRRSTTTTRRSRAQNLRARGGGVSAR